MDSIRERAINDLRYGGAQGLVTGAAMTRRERELSELEVAQIQAEKRWQIAENRRQALSAVVALGRRYDSIHEALEDARVMATFLGLVIEEA